MITLTESQKADIATMQNRRNEMINHPELKPLLEKVAAGVKEEQGREMSLYEKGNIAQCLMNAREWNLGKIASRGMLNEATTEDFISFLGIQLPVIAALLPSLVLNEIATVQPLDRRIAAVFFLNVLAAAAKGDQAATTLISSKTGVVNNKGGRMYGMNMVQRETITTDGAQHRTAIYPGLILLANATIERLTIAGTYQTIATCNAAGTFASVAGTGVTVIGGIAATGYYNVTVVGAASDDIIQLSYVYQYDITAKDSDGRLLGVKGVDVQVVQEAVTAIDFSLRADYSIGASIDLQKAHGINLEDEMIKYVGGMAKFAIDQYGLEQMIGAADDSGAADAVTTLVLAKRPGDQWALQCKELVDRLLEGSNNIYNKTKRGVANVAIVGNNVARVIRQLGSGLGYEAEFKPGFNFAKQTPTGPIVLGTIPTANNMTVVQNPFMDTNKYVLAYKGDSFLKASFIYAPYIPLFATPTLVLADLTAQKGFLSSAGFKVINNGLFCKGTISGLGARQQDDGTTI